MGKIAIFDSGVGGITVLEELYKLLPNEQYIYIGDSAYAPYGDKTNEQLEARVKRVINELFKEEIKLLVIACNTVASFMYKDIVEMLEVPVVGVVFPTVSYVNSLPFKNVGVFATSKTIKMRTYEKMIERNVISLATPELVPMIESKQHLNRELEIKKILKPLLDEHVEVLVMGCTHYPFIKSQVEKFFDGIIVESGFVTALEVKRILKKGTNFEEKGSVEIIITGAIDKFENVIKDYVTFKYSIVRKDI